jgi:hypothetical protein
VNAKPAPLHVVVDGANVVGSRPDGWWHDREGAARRLAGRLVASLAGDPTRFAELQAGASESEPRQPQPELTEPETSQPEPPEVTVHLVLEGRAARVEDLPTHPRLEVVRAPADGDTTIAEVAGGLPGNVIVVTADRELRERVRAGGAMVVGPGSLLRALPGAGAAVQ